MPTVPSKSSFEFNQPFVVDLSIDTYTFHQYQTREITFHQKYKKKLSICKRTFYFISKIHKFPVNLDIKMNFFFSLSATIRFVKVKTMQFFQNEKKN